VGELEKALRSRRDAGGRAFIPYVTGGYPGVDEDLLRSLEAAGADAVEIGIPFSDPVMDGGVIQEASRRSLESGTHPADVLATVKEASLGIPVVVMTYVNPVLRRGVESFLEDAAGAGVQGMVVPDFPVDEAGEFDGLCLSHGIDAVLLAAPGASADRLARIAGAARGFVYCVGSYGVTGKRGSLSAVAAEVVGSLRPLTDLPLLVGVGIGTPEQAAEACGFADGVIVGSALMALMVEGNRAGTLALAAALRASIPLVGPRGGAEPRPRR
jgi:tryptophan synthase alpha chain